MNANIKQITDKTLSRAIFRVFWALLVLFALLWQSAAAQVKPDDFEVDNTPQEAKFILLGEEHGSHNFHVAGDEDWVRLIGAQGEAGREYFVEFFSNENMDLVWALYDSDGQEPPIARGDNFDTFNDTFNWPKEEGFFFIKVTSASQSFGDASYTITITPNPSASVVYGNVRDEDTNEPLEGVTITIKGTILSTKTDGQPSRGQYALGLEFEPSVVEFILIAEHDGYEPFETQPIKFDAINFIGVKQDITLVKKNITVQPDEFEVDNTPQEAKYLFLAVNQIHNFHISGDEDWVRLIGAQGVAGQEYSVNISPGDKDIVWALYDSDAVKIPSFSNAFIWPEEEGFFFIQVTSASQSFGFDYRIRIIPSPTATTVYGNVRDKDTNEPLVGVTITIKETILSTKTLGQPSRGQYALGLKFEPSVVEFILIAEHDGYEPFETPPIKFDAINFIAVKKDITLQPEPEPEPEPDPVESKVLPIGPLLLLLLD